MDCVTCLMMGLCVMCGQHFGGSRLQTIIQPASSNLGQPMTRAQVNAVMQTRLRHRQIVNTNSNSYHRQSKLDPRFAGMGIGKRREQIFDPYNFSFGLGKRDFQDKTVAHFGLYPTLDSSNLRHNRVFNFERPNKPNLSDTESYFDKNILLLKIANLHMNEYPLLYKHMIPVASSISNYKHVIGEKTRNIKLYRETENPFLTLAGVR